MYDLICKNGHEQLDCLLKLGERPDCPTCGCKTDTLWQRSANVIGDECDVMIRHGICWENGEPRRFTSKAEMLKVAKEKGLINNVEHITTPGTDKNQHTTRWI